MHQLWPKGATVMVCGPCKDRRLLFSLFGHPRGWESKQEEVSRQGRCEALHKSHYIALVVQHGHYSTHGPAEQISCPPWSGTCVYDVSLMSLVTHHTHMLQMHQVSPDDLAFFTLSQVFSRFGPKSGFM
jgi:hypothetical protein